MIFDGSVHQLPDADPTETAEWLDSLDAVVETHGKNRARYLLSRLLERAHEAQVSFPATVSTPYVNSIAREHEPWFPGDEHIERRIRAYIRWNAAVMVVRANSNAEGIGGHLSSYASSASLYEVGFNHFFRGKDHGTAGDHIYFQGHAAPGIYARAFLEGRLDENDLDHFRREIGREGKGLSSYPHPRLMPEFWEFPTVSMGLGPITALYQARFNRYLQNRQIEDTSQSRVWAFLGDGECDEPEMGSMKRKQQKQDELQKRAKMRTKMREEADQRSKRGEYHLTLCIHECMYLPRLDQSLQDANLVGLSDPYVHIILADDHSRQEAQTEVKKSTLFPKFEQTFCFYFTASDKTKEKKETLTIQVWDWDLGKKNDFSGETVLRLQTLVAQYHARNDKSKPLEMQASDHLLYTYILTISYIHTCIHTYIHTYVYTYIRIYIHTYIHTYIHIHSYIHTHTHTDTHRHTHTRR